MTNNRRVPTYYLSQQLADYVMGLPSDSTPYPVSPEKIEPLENTKDLVGIYQSESDGTILKIVETDGILFRERYGEDPVKLINEEGALFQYERQWNKIHFQGIGTPGQNCTVYNAVKSPNTYLKLSEQSYKDYEKGELNADFYNDETDTRISLRHLEGNTYSCIKNGKQQEAELIIKDHLRMNTIILEIMRDEKNKIVGLQVTNRRIKNVFFQRT